MISCFCVRIVRRGFTNLWCIYPSFFRLVFGNFQQIQMKLRLSHVSTPKKIVPIFADKSGDKGVFRNFFCLCFFCQYRAAKNVFANKLHTFILNGCILLLVLPQTKTTTHTLAFRMNCFHLRWTIAWQRRSCVLSTFQATVWLLENCITFGWACVGLNAIVSFQNRLLNSSNGMYPTIPTPFHHIWFRKQCASREWLLIK